MNNTEVPFDVKVRTTVSLESEVMLSVTIQKYENVCKITCLK